MPADIRALLHDFAQETAVLDAILDGLSADDWQRPTPSPRWNVVDQVSHLAFFDEATTASILDPERFRRESHELVSGGEDFADRVAARHHDTPPLEILAWFRGARRELMAAYEAADPVIRLPWYGPEMGLASSITARFMETWAHAQDIADTFAIDREPTDRLRHVAHLGVASLPYSFRVNGRDLPIDAVHVELLSPGGEHWTWGPADAANRVTASALDFCLAVTQRRHLDDTDVIVVGDSAAEWMSLAQTFAGPAGTGRPPLGHADTR